MRQSIKDMYGKEVIYMSFGFRRKREKSAKVTIAETVTMNFFKLI